MAAWANDGRADMMMTSDITAPSQEIGPCHELGASESVAAHRPSRAWVERRPCDRDNRLLPIFGRAIAEVWMIQQDRAGPVLAGARYRLTAEGGR